MLLLMSIIKDLLSKDTYTIKNLIKQNNFSTIGHHLLYSYCVVQPATVFFK